MTSSTGLRLATSDAALAPAAAPAPAPAPAATPISPAGSAATAVRAGLTPPRKPLTRASSMPIDPQSSPRSARSHLAPEDAFDTTPTRRDPTPGFDSRPSGPAADLADSRRRRSRHKMDPRSRSRRRNRNWKKLLWVKQSYPDNYTDQATFLENLQRNPRLQPYEFWPLVADSTVILQQVCSVTVFVVCFVGIFQERASPVAVVGWGSFATFLGWLVWDWWVGQEEEDEVLKRQNSNRSRAAREPRRDRDGGPLALSVNPSAASSVTNLALMDRSYSQSNLAALRHPYSASVASFHSQTSMSPTGNGNGTGQGAGGGSGNGNGKGNGNGSVGANGNTNSGGRSSTESLDEIRHRPVAPLHSGRTSLRMSTVKSAILIYFTLLGLSPILKSLTRSTSSDSIWAMSFWLLAINIFFYDYSGGVGVKFPASLSTNAALMASTVLASRLPSTGQVFSLTLFSIEVFGLFPVFRRYARHRSWKYHAALTAALVVGAGLGVGLILGGEKDSPWPWKSGLLGVVVALLISIVAMGGCSWWLIGLQKYKNDINGPWDAARPIIISRQLWDGE